MDALRLTEAPTGKHLMAAGVVSRDTLRRMARELAETDPALGGFCPLDAERLRSSDAVEAYGIWLYVLVRVLRPRAVVETGVQNGCSTELILWAIRRNGRGRLFSIDSGPTSSDGSHHTPWHRTTDGIPGQHILEALKANWDLTIGLSRDRLLDVCRRAGNVDSFWHDSDHSPENVRFEFAAAKPFVSAGGILCLHDFDGQDVTLGEESYHVIVPQQAPHLRVWRKR